MSMAVLCREMKWTWHEYRRQPTWFVHFLLALMQEEIKAKKRPQSNE